MISEQTWRLTVDTTLTFLFLIFPFTQSFRHFFFLPHEESYLSLSPCRFLVDSLSTLIKKNKNLIEKEPKNLKP